MLRFTNPYDVTKQRTDPPLLQFIIAAAASLLCTLLALGLVCCCHCTRGIPKPALFKETAADRCKLLSAGFAVSVFVVAALGMILASRRISSSYTILLVVENNK